MNGSISARAPSLEGETMHVHALVCFDAKVLGGSGGVGVAVAGSVTGGEDDVWML